MSRKRRNHKPIRFAICSALAAALVAGCAGPGHIASAGHYSSDGKAGAKLDNAVSAAEQQVERNPRDVSSRIALADAYLHAGRFESAATTYNDAMALGDTSPRTKLSLALANMGAGRNREAVAILDEAGDSLSASDRGLALALAGETGRGVAILSDALRDGENTPKLRQNLAYAYALDGRWREARVMAAQDVPADQLDGRISHWAMQGKPEDYQKRVAGLLDAPVRSDPGQPMALALNGPTATEERVAAVVAPMPEPQPYTKPEDELPPVTPAGNFAYAEPEQPAPAAPPAVEQKPVDRPRFAASTDTPRYESKPVVQKVAARPVVKYSEPQQAKPKQAKPKPSKASLAASCSADDCTHHVQLGAFSSEKNAEHARKIYLSRNPELKNHGLQITHAVVRGKDFWRVAAVGFDKHAARGFCSSVKSRGGNCFAYSADTQLPGTTPDHGSAAPLMARR